MQLSDLQLPNIHENSAQSLEHSNGRLNYKALFNLRKTGITTEHLILANFPQESIDEFKDIEDRYPEQLDPTKNCYLRNLSLALNIHPWYSLLGASIEHPYWNMDVSAKPKVQCDICEGFFRLTKKGTVNTHSRCVPKEKTNQEA